MNALVVIDTLTPAVFSEPGGIDAVLSNLEAKVRAVKTDVSSKAGRKAIASLAYQVSRSKTAIDEVGEELGSSHYKSWQAICKERARIELRLDALRDEVRKPLDDYEAAEASRIAGHQTAIQMLIDFGTFDSEIPASGDVIYRLTTLGALPARDWQEFEREAEVARLQTFEKLMALRDSAMDREAEAAEFERLRIETAARERQEREDRIAAEAADRATKEAEEKAAAEVERAERERLAAVARADQAERETALAAERAERERVAAVARAEADRSAAIEAERRRVAAIEAAEAEQVALREADREHRKTINSAALAAFVAAGIPLEHGMKAVAAIARHQIPHVTIEY